MSSEALIGAISSSYPGIGTFRNITKNDPTIVRGSIDIIPFLTALKCLCPPILFTAGATLSSNIVIILLIISFLLKFF